VADSLDEAKAAFPGGVVWASMFQTIIKPDVAVCAVTIRLEPSTMIIFPLSN
jgi:hypothetical protein